MNSRQPQMLLTFALAACLSAAPALAQTGTLFVEGNNVGIGTATPAQPLQVVTTGAPSNTVIQAENDGPTRIRIKNTATGETWNIGHQSPSGTGLVYSDVGDAVSEMLLDVDGNLTIAGQLTTAGGSYPDYVFGRDYKLLPLSDLDSYIADNGHLPGVPTSEDVSKKGGVNMSQLQMLLLEKVEELTLYTLDQQKTIDKLAGSASALDPARLEQAQREVTTLKEDLQARDEQVAKLEKREADLTERLSRLENLLATSGHSEN